MNLSLHRIAVFLGSLWLSALLPAPALAGGVEAPEGDGSLVRRVAGVGSLRASTRQHLSGALGFVLYRQPEEYDCTTYCEFQGPLFQVEPGLAGARISAGYVKLVGEKAGNRFFLSDVYMGFAFRGSVLSTWGTADKSHQVMAGVEGEFSVAGFSFELGVMRTISGREPGDDPWRYNAAIGWYF